MNAHGLRQPDQPALDRDRAAATDAGFSLVDSMIAVGVLVVGTLTCVTLGTSCSSLQQRTRDYLVAHVIASDTMERMRSVGLTDTHAQYTASPTSTVQGRTVSVAFQEEAMEGVFGGAMDTAAALEAGFLPVRITVTTGQQNFVFTTFLGQR